MGNSCIRGRRRRRHLEADANHVRNSSIIMLSQLVDSHRLGSINDHLEDISFLSELLGDGPNTLCERESVRLAIRFIVRHYEHGENETLKKFALFQLHGFSEVERKFLVMIEVLIEEVPIDHSLGACIISMILEGGCLPTKDFIKDMMQQLNFRQAHTMCETKQKNSMCVVSAFAEKLAGYLSSSLVTQEVLEFIHSRMLELRQPPAQCQGGARVSKAFKEYAAAYGNKLEVACAALLTLQAFMQTNENRAQLVEQVESLQPPLSELLQQAESWLPQVEFGSARQIGSLSQLLLDNYVLPAGRRCAWATTDRSALNAMLSCADSTEAAKILPDGLEVRSDASSFESVRATFGAASGRWYYEATLVTDGIMQIGWCSADTEFLSHDGIGVGDDEASIGDDGCRQCVWHRGVPSSADYTLPKWRCGDVVGCLLDLDAKQVAFSLNGSWLAPQLELLKGRPAAGGAAYYPAASLMANQQCRFNFGRRPFRHPPQRQCRSPDAEGSLAAEQRRLLPWTQMMQARRERLMAEDFSELCQICADCPADAVLRPCGHEGVCARCVGLLTYCPFCRAPIDDSAAADEQ